MSIDRRESRIENCEDPVLFGSRSALFQASCAALKNCSMLEAFGPATGLDPSVIRAARASAAGAEPPSRSGGRGFCTGLGLMIEAGTSKNLPWNSTGSGPHRVLKTWIISVMRAPRWAIGTLLAENSSSE